METLECIKNICELLDKKKGNDISVLDIRKLSSISDYFIIVSADSERGVKSLAENLVKDLKKKLKIKVRIDGLNDGRWVLIDSGDVIIHIFHSDTRKIYDLESLWFEAKKLTLYRILFLRSSYECWNFKMFIIA